MHRVSRSPNLVLEEVKKSSPVEKLAGGRGRRRRQRINHGEILQAAGSLHGSGMEGGVRELQGAEAAGEPHPGGTAGGEPQPPTLQLREQQLEEHWVQLEQLG